MANPQHLMPNTQHPPLAITLCETLYAGGLLWARNRELKTSVTSVFSVRENNIQHKRKTSPRLSSVFFFSQKNTDEQNTQGFTETLSQPISQNVTATFSYNVLWYLYAGGVLWVRNCAQKGSVNSVCSVREKPPHYKSPMFFFSQRTQNNRTHSILQRH